jgi:hypothetical protein
LLALFKTDIYQGSACPACDIPIVAMNHNVEDIVDSIDIYQNSRDRSNFVPYYLWASDAEDFIMMIKPSDTKLEQEYLDTPEGVSLLTPVDDWEDESIFNEDVLDKWSNVTICCGAVLNGTQTACGCLVTVLPDDIQDFDEAMSAQGNKVYEAHSVCESCEHYYFPSCPGYREQVMKFAIEAELPTQPLSGCTSWEAYKNSSDYSMEGWNNYGV